MKTFEIVYECKNVLEHVQANTSREALCIYLMCHEELEDMMLWKSAFGTWKLAEYDNEDNCIIAVEINPQ